MSREDIETNECLFWDINDLYKTNNQKPIGLIYKVLECFSHTLLDNEIFLSESDFQFNFAQQVKDFGATDVILEYPILTKCLYEKDTVHFENIRKAIIETYSKYKAECSDKSCPNYNNYKKNKQNEKCIKCYKLAKFNNDRTFIDLRFRYHDDEYFIEFKYKLSDTADLVCRYSESEQFKIKNQGAHNLGRPEIYEDIERMEHLKLLKDNACCFVVFITNDSQYWRLNGDENNKIKNSKYCDFKLGAKIKKDCKNSKIKSYRKENQYTKSCDIEKKYLKYDKKKKMPRALFINYKYDITWANFKQINGSPFKVLVIDCNSPVNNN